MDNTMNYISILKESLYKKIEVLDEILRLNELQKESVSEEKFNEDKFEESIEKKDVCIAELNKLDSGFESVFKHVKEKIDENPDMYKKDVEEFQKLISEITE